MDTSTAALHPDRADALADAVDHLLGARTDATCLVTATGTVLSASALAARLLEGSPGLRAALRRAVRETGRRAATGVFVDGRISLHLTPCTSRGTLAWLVVVGEGTTPEPGRRRVTARQSELLEALGEGLTNAEIGARLDLSPSTVKTTLERLYRRAGVRGRVALVGWARRA